MGVVDKLCAEPFFPVASEVAPILGGTDRKAIVDWLIETHFQGTLYAVTEKP
jgi:hypothetical protein